MDCLIKALTPGADVIEEMTTVGRMDLGIMLGMGFGTYWLYLEDNRRKQDRIRRTKSQPNFMRLTG